MAIGFMSFGGMLTGSEDAPANEEKVAEKKEVKEEANEEAEITYNQAIKK